MKKFLLLILLASAGAAGAQGSPPAAGNPEKAAFSRFYEAAMNAHLASRLKEAEKHYMAAMAEAKKLEGADWEYWRSSTLLAVAYAIHGYPAYAEQFFTPALAYWSENDRAAYGGFLSSMGYMYLVQKKYAKAEKLLRQALPYVAADDNRGSEKYATASLLAALGDICDRQGQAACAEQNYKKALAYFSGKTTAFPYQVLDAELMYSYPMILCKTGELALRGGRSEEAGRFFARSLEAWTNWTMGDGRPAMGALIADYRGRALLGLGRTAAGVESLKKALAVYKKLYPSGDPRAAEAESRLAAADKSR